MASDGQILWRVALRDEEHSAALRHAVRRWDLVGCDLLRTEVRRATFDAPQARRSALAVLDRIPLIQLYPRHFDAAGELPGRVRSLDALHVVATLDLGDDLDVFATYDDRQADVSRSVGIEVVVPT